MKRRKQVAIMGGGDWADASVDLLSLPSSVSLDEALAEYNEWRDEHSWISFPDWLRRYKKAEDSTVEEFWDE